MTTQSVFVSVVFLITCIATPVGAQDDTQNAEAVDAVERLLASTKPLEINDGEAPLQKLLKKRFNVALEEFAERYAGHQSGTSTSRQLFDAGVRLTESDLALANSPAEQVAVLQRHLPTIREFEMAFEALVKSGLRERADLNELRYERLTFEIKLERAKAGG